MRRSRPRFLSCLFAGAASVLAFALAVPAVAAAELPVASSTEGPADPDPTSEPDPTPEPETGPGAGRPATGTCHLLSASGVAADSLGEGTETACTERHTTITLGAVEVRGSFAWDNAWAVRRNANPACDRGSNVLLGGGQPDHLSDAYLIAVFIPTPEERERGARWISCHLYKPGARGVQALPHRSEALRLGRFPFADRDTGCLTTRLARTSCDQSHAWRVTGTVPTGRRFYGERTARRDAIRKCPEVVTSRRFRYQAPTRYTSALGIVHAVCYSRTRD